MIHAAWREEDSKNSRKKGRDKKLRRGDIYNSAEHQRRSFLSGTLLPSETGFIAETGGGLFSAPILMLRFRVSRTCATVYFQG